MRTKMNLEGTTRKMLVKAIEQITGEKAIYRRVPTCNYDIGEITVTKDGSIVCPDDSNILDALAEAGFKADEAEMPLETNGSAVSLPADGFTDATSDNQRKLVDAKALLIRKALDTDGLDIVVKAGKVSFPWWEHMPEPEEIQAYTAFLAALCKIYTLGISLAHLLQSDFPLNAPKKPQRTHRVRLRFLCTFNKKSILQKMHK